MTPVSAVIVRRGAVEALLQVKFTFIKRCKKSPFLFVFSETADLELLGNILIVADQVMTLNE